MGDCESDSESLESLSDYEADDFVQVEGIPPRFRSPTRSEWKRYAKSYKRGGGFDVDEVILPPYVSFIGILFSVPDAPTNPKIQAATLAAIDHHNEANKGEKNLELVKIVKANEDVTLPVYLYYITFVARVPDTREENTYQTVVSLGGLKKLPPHVSMFRQKPITLPQKRKQLDEDDDDEGIHHSQQLRHKVSEVAKGGESPREAAGSRRGCICAGASDDNIKAF